MRCTLIIYAFSLVSIIQILQNPSPRMARHNRVARSLLGGNLVVLQDRQLAVRLVERKIARSRLADRRERKLPKALALAHPLVGRVQLLLLVPLLLRLLHMRRLLRTLQCTTLRPLRTRLAAPATQLRLPQSTRQPPLLPQLFQLRLLRLPLLLLMPLLPPLLSQPPLPLPHPPLNPSRLSRKASNGARRASNPLARKLPRALVKPQKPPRPLPYSSPRTRPRTSQPHNTQCSPRRRISTLRRRISLQLPYSNMQAPTLRPRRAT